MKRFLAKNIWYLGGALVIVVIGGIVWYASTSKAPLLGSYTVARENVVASVDIPGSVSSDNSVDLSFQEPGQIAHVYVKEGDAVAAGQTLADLDASSFSAALVQANAGLSAAQAKLDNLTNGTRPEQLDIDQNAVANAAATISVQVGSAYTAADDAVRNQIDNLFTNPKSNNPIFVLPSSDSQLVTNIQAQRASLEAVLGGWYKAENALNADPSALSAIANTSLAQVKKYLDSVALPVNAAMPTGNVTAAQLAAYKLNVVTARNEVTGAISALTNAESALHAAQDQLTLAQAGATTQDIEAQKAAVLQAQAQVQSVQVAVDRASLRAPFSGTARNVTAKAGQVVSPGSPVLSIINTGGLKIDAYIAESDVSKIKEGDAANVTLDAYGEGTIFSAKIAAIDTVETQVQGSPAYQVTLYFTTPDARVRAGMIANVHIVGAEHDNVLSVPARLVINDGSDHFVLVTNGNATQRQAVTLGITGDNGTVEILSGLKEGDRISNF